VHNLKPRTVDLKRRLSNLMLRDRGVRLARVSGESDAALTGALDHVFQHRVRDPKYRCDTNEAIRG